LIIEIRENTPNNRAVKQETPIQKLSKNMWKIPKQSSRSIVSAWMQIDTNGGSLSLKVLNLLI